MDKKRKYNTFQQHQIEDVSGTLLIDKWGSCWKYRHYHVRVVLSNNTSCREGTVFPNSTVAACYLLRAGYSDIHHAIMRDVEIEGCILEYTNTKHE